MDTIEGELKGLMQASLGGDEAAYRNVLGRLSRYLRGYYRARYRGSRSRDAAGDSCTAAYLRSGPAVYALGLCDSTLQAHRLS